MKTPFDMEAFLDQTFFGLDTAAMLDDIEDFIDFSESNITWQKKRERRLAEKECEEVELDDPQHEAQYHNQLLESVDYRFDVCLTQRVRYAALTSIITTIEWVLLSLGKRAASPIPRKPDGANESVHILRVFSERGGLGLEPRAETLEKLVQVRNCVVHGAGLLGSSRYEDELRLSIAGMTGIKISNVNFLGDGIEIEGGFLQKVVEEAT